MSLATRPPPARLLATIASVGLLVIAVALAFSAAPAQAAKPCWERAIDDWVDNGVIEGDYSPSCIAAAKRHVPEDIRTYTDIMDKLDAYRQESGRKLAIVGSSSGAEPEPSATNPNSSPKSRPSGKDEGPIPSALSKGTTDASSIPLPLIVLAGLALLLMAAGAAGFAQRKLQARRISSGSE